MKTADWEDEVLVVVNCRILEVKMDLELIVVASCKK
jgi:hypothetical protein